MAHFSESELDVIEVNPISDEFRALLTTVKSTHPNAKVANSPTGYEKLLAAAGTCNAQHFRPS